MIKLINQIYKRTAVFFLLLCILMSLFVGCGGESHEVREQQIETVEKEQRIELYTIPCPTGDWGYPSPFAHSSRGPGYLRMSLIFDTLIWKDDTELIPALAKQWEFIEEENAYIFYLRDDVTWHDGEKFSAQDVIFTFEYTNKHPHVYVDPDFIKKVDKIEEFAVKIYLDRPYAPFLHFIAATLPIIPEHIWNNVENPAEFQQDEALIGTGPFQLADYQQEHGNYIYKAYEDYYQGTPRVKNLKLEKISQEVVSAALKQGQVNMAAIPSEMVESLKNDGFEILIGPYSSITQLMFNHHKAPMDSKEFRQAIAYAVDRQALVETTQRGFAIPGSPGVLSPDGPWFNPNLPEYEYNPSKAEELIEKMGYEKNGSYYHKDGDKLSLELVVESARSEDAEMIKHFLEDIGIEISLRSLDAATQRSLITEWEFDLSLQGHGATDSDPEILNKAITGPNDWSVRYEKNQELLNLLEAQLQEMDQQKRFALVKKIQEIYAKEVLCVPLYYTNSHYAHDGKVNLFYTIQGISIGIPMPLNKMSFVQ